MPDIGAPAAINLKKTLTAQSVSRRSALAHSTSLERVVSAPLFRNDLSPKLKFERRQISSLKPAKRRVRKDSPAHTERLVRVIQRVGVCYPILIDNDGHVIDGHTVVAAAKALGIDSLPCAIIDHLGKDDIEFLKVALNRVSECGEWDLEELKPLLIELRDSGFVLEDTGFSVPQIDQIIIGDASVQGEEQPAPEPPDEPVSQLGDLWLFDQHRLYCGDATDTQSFEVLLQSAKTHAIFTDPPWNIPIEGFVSTRHKDFKMAAGELSPEQFAEFVGAYTRLCAEVLEARGVMFECIDWRSHELIVRSAREAGLQLINTAIWNKGSGGMGGLYRSAHELIPVFCKGTSSRVNNVALGRHGRDRTNVWTYPGANRPGSSANSALKHHPTPKPVEMVHDAIIDVTNLGEIVLDPFMGSGTTLLAAELSGRIARGIELDPAYVDVCIARWEAQTGRNAVHEESGLSFVELRRVRCDQRGAD